MFLISNIIELPSLPAAFFDSAPRCFFFTALPALQPRPAQPPDIPGWSALDAGVACLSLRAFTGKYCRPLRASGAVSIYRLRGRGFLAVRLRASHGSLVSWFVGLVDWLGRLVGSVGWVGWLIGWLIGWVGWSVG
ncbi:MAG: hypothetical protein BWX77_00007 [Bacteroidetes bacterium ADurb.Bin090]|nr:MAG: hypothetical protein BWX77_00007 [Bacteroidetes bacterium ADurb.Bin090]